MVLKNMKKIVILCDCCKKEFSDKMAFEFRLWEMGNKNRYADVDICFNCVGKLVQKYVIFCNGEIILK